MITMGKVLQCMVGAKLVDKVNETAVIWEACLPLYLDLGLKICSGCETCVLCLVAIDPPQLQ